MTQEIIGRLFEFALLGGAGVCLAVVVLAAVYDLQSIARRRRIKAAVRRLQRRSAQPSITVLVYASNDAGTITACLESLSRITYQRYDVIIVDNVSSDGTQRAVRRFMREHSGPAMRFYAKRKRGSLDEVIRQAYRKSRKGELIVALGASSRPPRSLLEEVAARFLVQPDLRAMSVNERVTMPLTITSLVFEVARAAGHGMAKGLSLLKVRQAQVGLHSAYRSDLVMSGEKVKARFESSLPLSVVRAGQPLDIAAHPFIWTVLAAAALLLMTYAMIMAASLISYVPLILAWSLVSVGSLAVIWSDESITLMKKLQLTLSATLICFLAYVLVLRFLLLQITRGALVLLKAPRPRLVWRVRRRAIF